MKKSFLYIIVSAVFLLGSCTDVLDVTPKDSFTDVAIWGDLALSETYLNAQYQSIEDEVSRGVSWACYTDEVYMRHNYGMTNVTQGYLSSDIYQMGWTDFRWDHWGKYYSAISNINRFLEKIQDVPAESESDQEWKNRQIGEGHFIRAYLYMMVYSLYYKAVLIDHTFALDEDYTTVQQADRDVMLNFILGECQKAADLLPLQRGNDELGRATKGAALAVKARVLLYAASKLFDENYPDKAKWEKATQAQKDVIELGVYSLPQVTTSEEYARLFITNTNPEIIFQKLFDAKWKTLEANNSFLHQAPCGVGNGFEGWGSFGVTQEMVNCFQKADGSDAGPYDWEGRDLRFEGTIFTDGDMWGYGSSERKIEVFISDVEGIEQGKDSQRGPYWWNAWKTGYGMRKFLDRTFDNYGTNAYTAPWITFRLAEFYLNYAECQIELGNTDEALKYINEIRSRVQMPPVTADNLREKYERERRVELAFEGQRWFDLRRWMKTEEVYRQPTTGVDIYKQADGSYKFVPVVVEQKIFKAPQQYWLPIPRYELRRAPQLNPYPYQ